MNKQTKVIKLPVGEISGIKKLADGSFEVVMLVPEKKPSEVIKIGNDEWILVEAESLSLDDEFLQWEPRNERQEKTKELIISAITSNVKNFYRPKYDPSFTDDGGIQFVRGKKTIIGRPSSWWRSVANNYNPTYRSRLGTRLEYAAFLGVLMKKLIEEGRTVEWTWNAVCNDSKELGNYRNSKNKKGFADFTGSRSVCEFYDLANFYKIIVDDAKTQNVCLASGSCLVESYECPIADIDYAIIAEPLEFAVGWIVLS